MTGTVGSLYITRNIVVNHTLKMFNIDSTSDQIGGQQEVSLMVFEAFQNDLAVLLTSLASDTASTILVL